jgi:hypothetical protein
MRRGERCEFAVRVIRRQAFDGPLELTVEGFSSGRDNDRAPRGIAASFAVEAVALQPGQAIAVFKLRARSDCELGARAVVVRAEGRIAGRPAVEYSPPVMVSVRE